LDTFLYLKISIGFFSSFGQFWQPFQSLRPTTSQLTAQNDHSIQLHFCCFLRIMLSTLNLVRSISRRPIGVNGVNAVAAWRCKSTVGTAPSKDDQNTKDFFPVYVHNVSRMVLEHLQENQSGWIMEKGLDRRLNINPNGTFTMSFPAQKGVDSGKIWYVVVGFDPTIFLCLGLRFSPTVKPLLLLLCCRTSYDSAHKQHWLSVYRQKLAIRFLLREHGPNSPKVLDASTTERKVAQAVDQMISAVNQTESQGRR
jgi:hypothetical protein